MTTPSKVILQHTAFKAAACATTLAALLALATTARAQTDSFDSGGGGLDPAAGWALFSNPTYPTTYTFPADSYNGHAFRMQGGVPGNAAAGGLTTARAAAVCTNQVYSDFYVAADLLNWETNFWHQTNYTFLGLVARVTTNLNGVLSGTNWSGMALFSWLNVDTQENPPGPGTAVLGLGWVINGNMAFTLPTMNATVGGVVPAAVTEWTLEPGRAYRVTFQGVGKDLTGKVYDTQDLTTPLGTVYGDTTIWKYELVPGTPVGVPAPTNGWSGLFAVRFDRDGNTQGTTDATFDNFYAAATPPTSVSAPATPNGKAGVAQVINRTPASWANFYSPVGGITFTASTLSTTTVTNVSLILNGVDVSSSLTITPSLPTTSAAVSFGLAGSQYSLASNTVYDASIILKDSLGRRTTNAWTFDTFTEAYLAKYGNIECEDYDANNGSYVDFPVPASGYSTNDNTWYLPLGLTYALGYEYGINIANNPGIADPGYVGLKGLQATNINDPGDYYECARTTPMQGAPLTLFNFAGGFDLEGIFPGCEYRTGGADAALGSWPNFYGAVNGDAVGTERGAAYLLSIQNITATNGDLKAVYRFDTKRQKYAPLNAAGLAQYPAGADGATGSTAAPWWDVEEYTVMGTEGSDWLNYTHDWGTATNYNVYLRSACALSQHLYLYNGKTNDPTRRFGVFYCTNALTWNWRYTPLLDAGGNLATVNLGGIAPLRLEVDPEHPKWASIRRGLALNYMAFVPASSCQITLGPAGAVTAGAQWQLDGGAWYNSGASVSASPGLHTVSFKAAPHWTSPANQIVTITAGQTTSTTATYTPGLTLWSTAQVKANGTSWTLETGAIVDNTNQRVTNTLPASTRYYQIRSDAPTQITSVSKSGANLILKYSSSSSAYYQPGLHVRAWKDVANPCAGALDGAQFDLNNPAPAPNDSTPSDPTHFPNGLGTIGYATQTINMPNTGPLEHFTAWNACGVAFPGPFPAGYAQNYMVEYRGSLYIATAGSYSFATSSDDGSALWIDAGVNPTYSTATVTNNFCQPLTQRSSGAQTLTAGYHDLIIRFNQGGGGNALQVYWDPTGGTNFVLIPGSLFYHESGL